MASIDERGENNWRIRVYAGRDPGTGKKKYTVETVHGGRRDAGTLSEEHGNSKPR